MQKKEKAVSYSFRKNKWYTWLDKEELKEITNFDEKMKVIRKKIKQTKHIL